jgi:hypothetical protein
METEVMAKRRSQSEKPTNEMSFLFKRKEKINEPNTMLYITKEFWWERDQRIETCLPILLFHHFDKDIDGYRGYTKHKVVKLLQSYSHSYIQHRNKETFASSSKVQTTRIAARQR